MHSKFAGTFTVLMGDLVLLRKRFIQIHARIWPWPVSLLTGRPLLLVSSPAAPTVVSPCNCAEPTCVRSKPTAAKTSSWNASTERARPAGPGFFPLDEELGLLPGNLTPRLQEAVVRLSSFIPSFAKAARELTWFTGATVHADTARRRTETAGSILVACETAQATRILREHPAPPCTPDTLLLSVDGAMVPLVHGQWSEVRTLAVGDVQPPVASPAGPVVHTQPACRISHVAPIV